MPSNETYRLMDNHFVLALTAIDYMFILVFGLVGNLRVSFMVSSDMSKKKAVNVFMSYKAVANILLCLFVLPTFPVLLVMKIWPSCYFVCHLWPVVYHALRIASLITVSAILVDFLLKITLTSMTIVIVTIEWLAMFMATVLPRVIIKNQNEIGCNNNSRYNSCQPGRPFDSIPETMSTMKPETVMMAVVLTLYVLCFVGISPQLWRMFTSKSTKLKAKHPMTRTTRLVVIVAVACGICWMPIALSQVVPVNSKDSHMVIGLGVVDVIAMSLMCFTPLSYMWLNGITINQFLLPGQWFSDRSPQSDTVDTALTTNDVRSSTTLHISIS